MKNLIFLIAGIAITLIVVDTYNRHNTYSLGIVTRVSLPEKGTNQQCYCFVEVKTQQPRENIIIECPESTVVGDEVFFKF